MQVLIQRKQSLRYRNNSGTWTRDPAKAMSFRTSRRAIDFCVANRISEVQLVIRSRQEPVDLVCQIAAELRLRARQESLAALLSLSAPLSPAELYPLERKRTLISKLPGRL